MNTRANRLTKQGVRDLNPRGHKNPSRQPKRECFHVWKWEYTYEAGDYQRCLGCKAVR